MAVVLVSTKGQIVLPAAVRKALGLKPGMRVDLKLDGGRVLLTPVPGSRTVSLKAIQALLNYGGPSVSVRAMRVMDGNG